MKKGELWCDGRVVIPDVTFTQHVGERLIGLLGRHSLPVGCGLLISPCGAVHTLGMRFAIDLVFIGADWHVIWTVANVPPGRLAVCGGRHARHTLELQTGWMDLKELADRHVRWQSLDKRGAKGTGYVY